MILFLWNYSCILQLYCSHLVLYPYALLLIWQGRFEILCLSGSYLVLDDGGTRTRSGGLCIALCGPDHRVIGGSVGGVLTAAGTVQVSVIEEII